MLPASDEMLTISLSSPRFSKRKQRVRHAQRAERVDVVDAQHVGEIERVFDRRVDVAEDGGVVDEQVEPVGLGFDRLCGVAHAFVGADVERQDVEPVAGSCPQAVEFRAFSQITPRKDAVTLLQQHTHEREAEPAVGAGDEGVFHSARLPFSKRFDPIKSIIPPAPSCRNILRTGTRFDPTVSCARFCA